MPDSNHPAGDAERPAVLIDIPADAELWVGIQEEPGFAPAVLVGGNSAGLRMLAAHCMALAESRVPEGQLALQAGAELLAGSEADLLLALQPEDAAPAAADAQLSG